MKFLKKNQIIIYTFALMLVIAGYLNYSNNIKENSTETASSETVEENGELVENTKETSLNETEGEKLSDIGDATLVSSNDIVKEDYFATSKLERETMYSEMLESYEKILNSSNSLEEQKQEATQEITKINEIQNGIMICENLIKTKGFENCVIFVNGESVSIIIGAEKLEQDQIAQIQNIISRELKVKIEDIHISTK